MKNSTLLVALTFLFGFLLIGAVYQQKENTEVQKNIIYLKENISKDVMISATRYTDKSLFLTVTYNGDPKNVSKIKTYNEFGVLISEKTIYAGEVELSWQDGSFYQLFNSKDEPMTSVQVN